MVEKPPDIASTAWTVARNVERLRVAQNMNFKQMSERLQAAADWPINAVGIRRIEAGERRVTPDDLTALAVALGVSPITLLMPHTDDKTDLVEVTGFEGDLTAEQLWKWLSADDTLPQTPRLVRTLGAMFRLAHFGVIAWPAWVHEIKQKENMASLLQELREKGVKGFGDDQ